MIDDEDVRSALDAIEAQWNNAEDYVKRVERLRRGLVVTASINEFRYAGRRFVEAYTLAKTAVGDPAKRQEALDFLREVKLFCMRAQHDAMDAAVTYIDQALAKFEQEFGPDLLHEKFPNYLPMKAALREVSEVMAKSRGDREKRDELYTNIRDGIVPTLIDHHLELESSSGVLTAAYTRRVKNEQRETARFYILAGIAAATLIAAVFAVPMIADQFKGPEPQHAASIHSTGESPDGSALRK